MRRLMAMVAHHRVDLSPLVTHYFPLDDIQEAYEVFSQQRHGVLKVALYPDASRMPAARRTSAVPAAVLQGAVEVRRRLGAFVRAIGADQNPIAAPGVGDDPALEPGQRLHAIARRERLEAHVVE